MRIRILALICSLLCGACHAVEHPFDGRWKLPLTAALEGGDDLELTIMVRNGHVVQSWAINPFSSNKVMKINHEKLFLTEDGLMGTASYSSVNNKGEASTHPIALALKIDGNAIDGSFKTERKRGTVAGVLHQQLTSQEDPLPANAGWTQWRNHNQRTQADPSNNSYVDDLATARFVWQSEIALPTGRGPDNRRPTPMGNPLGTGMGGVTVADNKVFMAYYIPDGDGYWKERADTHRRTGAWGREKSMGLADEYVVALDAGTGEVIWQRKFDGTGINFMAFSKGGPQITPIIWEDKIYVLGGSGNIYCLNAADGSTVWTNDIGPRAASMRALAAHWDRTNGLGGFSRTMVNDPVVADGIVVVGDNRKWKGETGYHYEVTDGLLAFDAHTGKPLWAVPECTNTWSTPYLWRYQGESYIITGGKNIHCIELKTGKIRWKLEGMAGLNHPTVADEVNILLTNGEESENVMTGYRISPDGTEKLWSLGAGWIDNNCVAATDGRIFYAFGRGVQKIAAINAESGAILSEIPNMDPGQGEHGGTLTLFDGFLISPAVQRGKGWQLIKADPSNLQLLSKWMAPTADVYVNGIMPAIVDGRFFFRSPTGVVCYDLRRN